MGLTLANVSVRIQAWQVVPGSKVPKMLMLDHPMMVVEVSYHKAMLGHNVYGGPRDIYSSTCWILNELETTLDTYLGEHEEWTITRLDIAETFDLGSEQNVMAWVNARMLAKYPRREVAFYGDSGCIWPGSTTTLRAYAKGKEHVISGGNKTLQRTQHAIAAGVMAEARRYLRCELQINKDKLTKLWQPVPNCATIKRGELNELYDSEWKKVIHEAVYTSPVLRASNDVWEALSLRYPDRSKDLYGDWMILSTRGEVFYRTLVSRATWSRNKAIYAELGISWAGTDVTTTDYPIADFVPQFSEHRRQTDTAPAVSEAEAVYA